VVTERFNKFYEIVTHSTFTYKDKVDAIFTMLTETIKSAVDVKGNTKSNNVDLIMDIHQVSVSSDIKTDVDAMDKGFEFLEDKGFSLGKALNFLSGPLTAILVAFLGLQGPVGIALGAFTFLATKTDFLTDMMKAFKGEMEFSEVIENVGDMTAAFIENTAEIFIKD